MQVGGSRALAWRVLGFVLLLLHAACVLLLGTRGGVHWDCKMSQSHLSVGDGGGMHHLVVPACFDGVRVLAVTHSAWIM